MLIRRVKLTIVRVNNETKQMKLTATRQYVSPPSARGKESYLPITTVMDDERLKAELLDRAKMDLIALKMKYAELVELSEIWALVDLL